MVAPTQITSLIQWACLCRQRYTAVTLPALTAWAADTAAVLESAAGPQAASLIDWVPDPR